MTLHVSSPSHKNQKERVGFAIRYTTIQHVHNMTGCVYIRIDVMWFYKTIQPHKK